MSEKCCWFFLSPVRVFRISTSGIGQGWMLKCFGLRDVENGAGCNVFEVAEVCLYHYSVVPPLPDPSSKP